MQIPADMHKWRTRFAWEMAGFAVLSLVLAVAMVANLWFFRAQWPMHPAGLFLSTVVVAFAAAALGVLASVCVGVSISTRRHDATVREMEKNRPPLTLSNLRDELRPEKLEHSRGSILRTLQTMSPETRAYTEAKLRQLSARYRADLEPTPEADTAITELEAFTEDVLRQASMPRI